MMLLMLYALVCALPTWAYDFSAENDEGTAVYYNIASSFDLTVEVNGATVTNMLALRNTPSNITILESVDYGGMTYNVTIIGDYAFYGCDALENVTISSYIKETGKAVFAGYYSLTKLLHRRRPST